MSKICLSAFLVAMMLLSVQCNFLQSLKKDPCPDELFSGLVTDLGYPFESHQVTTEDGYILRLFRIQAKGSKIVSGKKVVLLQHGLLDSSDDWVVNDEDKSLGFVLANAGYDVWFSNSRGNKYSRKNTKLTPAHRDFWYYSFQEMGEFDVKANIDFIINFTGVKKLTYVGHSQGTSQMFAALSDPKTTAFVNAKLNGFIALAPVAYLPNADSPIVKFLAADGIFILASEIFGLEEWLPGACSKSSAQSDMEAWVCKHEPKLCDIFISLIADFNPKYDNEKKFPDFVRHNPSGASLRCLLHYRQLFETDKHHPIFKKYDYGAAGNMKKYGQKHPPEYDLNLINIPVRGFVGTDDELGDPIDNTFLTAKLQQLGKDYKTYTYDNCGHLTFMWALDPSRIFKNIMAEITALNA